MTDIVQLPEHLHILNTSYLFIAEDNSASQRFKIQIGTIVEMTDIVQLLDHLHIEDILFVDRTYGQSRMIRVIVTSIVKVVFTRIIFGSERLTLKGAVKLCHRGCACSISGFSRGGRGACHYFVKCATCKESLRPLVLRNWSKCSCFGLAKKMMYARRRIFSRYAL